MSRTPGRSPACSGLVLFGAALVAAAACGAPNPGFRAESVDVALDVAEDGSIVVSETTTGRLGDDRTSFDRLVTGPRLDRIEWLSATFDGTSVAPDGSGPVLLEVEDGARLRVRWEVGPSSTAATHRFSVSYRVHGAVEGVGRRGRLVWVFGGRSRRYPVEAARVSLSIPATSTLLGGTGIAESGWTVETTEGGLVATRQGVGSDPATLLAEFAIDPTRMPFPAWQVTADRRRQFAPAFVSAALFMLVIGGGVFWMIRLQHLNGRAPSAGDGPPSESLPPAVVAVLLGGRPSGLRRLVATVVDARFGDTRPDDSSDQSGAAGGRDASWTHAAVVARWAEDRELPSALGDDLARMVPAFDAALGADCVTHGLVDRDRQSIASGLQTTAVVGALVVLVCATLAAWLLAEFGWWGQLIPGAMLLVVASFALAGWRMSVLSGAGQQARAYWRSRLRQATRNGAAGDGPLWLAVLSGQGNQWLVRHGSRLDAHDREWAAALFQYTSRL